jgi:hypothetical protein
VLTCSRQTIALMFALLLALLSSPVPAAEVVKMGDLPAISNAGLYIAIEKDCSTPSRSSRAW